jgi:hypothetical protein
VTAAEERIAVRDLGRHGRVWLLAVEGRDAIPSVAAVTCHGWGLPSPKPFSAVFVHEQRAWLQMGPRRWDVSQIASVEQDKEGLLHASYRLLMTDGTVERIRFRYSMAAVRQALLDPTYDEIDSWSHDVMKLLPNTAADGWGADLDGIEEWLPRVINLWGKGITPEGTLVE